MHAHLRLLDGVMVGRGEAYHNPGGRRMDAVLGTATLTRKRSSADARLLAREEAEHGTQDKHRPPHARPAQRPPRSTPLAPGLSDHRLKTRHPHEVMAIAHEPAEQPA